MDISNANIPKSMRYGLQSATAIQASTTLARFSSINGNSFTSSGSNQIRIRCSAQGFLDGDKHYLQFTITNAAAAMHVDTSAQSFIDRLRIEANGVVIEEINSYGLYASIQQTYNSDLSKVFKLATQSGAAQLEIKNAATGAGTDGVIVKAEVGSLGEGFTATHSKVFTIQLESGLLKNHHSKALPDGMVELDIILTLAGNNQAVIAATGTAPTWTLTDPALFCPVYRIENADVMNAYRQTVASGGIMFSGVTAKTYINAVANSAGTKSLQINDRSLSCLGLVTALRDAGVNSVIDKYANGAYGFSDGTGLVTRMKYLVNGVNYPQSDIDITAATNGLNVGRVYEEAIKALAKNGKPYSEANVSRHQLKGSVNDVYASVKDTASTEVPKGLLSVSLKKFDDNMLRMTGLNTSANSSPNVLEFVHTAFAAGGLEATTFAIVEAFYQMQPNGSLSVAM
tara:strand:- start:144 stop:1511 length:1368 start_codon:yes stop_codon:yes gene_type:complete